MKEQLQYLIDRTNFLLKFAKKNRNIDFMIRAGAYCSHSEYVLDNEGGNYFRVFICGASPESFNLQGYIQEQFEIEELDVRVSTEW